MPSELAPPGRISPIRAMMSLVKAKPLKGNQPRACSSFELLVSRIAHACPTWGAFVNEFAHEAHIKIVNKICPNDAVSLKLSNLMEKR